MVVCKIYFVQIVEYCANKSLNSIKIKCREDDVLHFANRLPDIHFTFSIFHFQFKSSARRTVAHSVYCTVTVIVTLDVLLSTSVTEYVTLYLPFRVVTTLPKTSIFDVISLPQVSTAVTPARA